MKITVETTVHAPITAVWDAYTRPEDILQWNAASDLDRFAGHVVAKL